MLRDGRSVGGGITKETPVQTIISLMVGRTVDELYPHLERALQGDYLVSRRHLLRTELWRKVDWLRLWTCAGAAGCSGPGCCVEVARGMG